MSIKPGELQLCESNDAGYPCGVEAKKALSQLIEDKPAVFKFTGDVTYGRPVATVFVDGKDMNLQLVRNGWAVVYQRYISDDEMKARYLEAQNEAKAAKAGIWAGEFIWPSKWRAGDRLDCEENPV